MKCRLCVFDFSDEELTAVNNEEVNLTKLIVLYLHLEITQNDQFSTKICSDCMNHLFQFHEFFEKINERQQQLKAQCLEQSKILETNFEIFESLHEPEVSFKSEATDFEEEEFAYAVDKSNYSDENEPNLEFRNLDDRKVEKTDDEFIVSSSGAEKRTDSENVAAIVAETSKETQLTPYTPEEEKEREQFIEKNIELKCEICQVVVPVFKEFQAHYRNEHKQKAFITCCGLSLKKTHHLIEHLRLHGDSKQEDRRKVDASMNKRRLNQKDKEEFIRKHIEMKCEICGDILPAFKKLQAHFKKEHKQDAFITCCGTVYKRQCYLFQHLRLQHDNASKPKKKLKLISLTPEEDKQRDELIEKHVELKCEICGETFSTFKEFQNHFKKVHNQSAYITCCSMRFSRRWSIWEHINSHIDPNYLKCKFCGKQLLSLQGFRNHIKKYHDDKNEKKFECETCHKRFTFRLQLKDHMISHQTSLNQQCIVCNKRFKTLKSLRAHADLHGERKLFVCHICGKELANKQSLEMHMSGKHSDRATERAPASKKKCSICSKWYSSSSLKVHMKYHELENVECKLCGKMFSSQAHLKTHMYGPQHKEAIFECTICFKKFSSKQSLKTHITAHSGNKDYSCQYCSKQFIHITNMNRHMRNFHAEEYAQLKAQKSNAQS